jgi:hypothetical protein
LRSNAVQQQQQQQRCHQVAKELDEAHATLSSFTDW